MGRASALAAVLLQLGTVEPAGAAQEVSTFQVPGEDYLVVIDLSGCVIVEDRPSSKKTGRYVRANCKTSVNVSFWIEPAEKPGNSRVCRDTWWPRDSGGVTDFAMRELGDLAVVDYSIGDDLMKQRNVRAYLAYGDTWIDFHLSRIEIGGSGAVEALDRLLRTIGIGFSVNEGMLLPDPRADSSFG